MKSKSPKLKRDTPLVEAVEIAIGKQIKSVIRVYAILKDADFEDPEVVHQLRVSSRRTAVAIKLFAPCIPKLERKRLTKAIKRIRDVAGLARDWDVFLQSLRIWGRSCTPEEVAGSDFLVGFALGHQAAAQGVIESLTESMDVAKLKRLWADAKKSIRIPEEWASLDLAGHARAKISEHLEACSKACKFTKPSTETLHRARIEAKGLRYSIELLGDCLENRSVDDLLKAAVAVQECLGIARDSHASSERVANLSDALHLSDPEVWMRINSGLRSFAAYQKQLGDEQEVRFLDKKAKLLKAHF